MVDNILVFVANHSNLTYLFIFSVSLSESLALVGLLVPGTVVMFGIGALVGAGGISLIPTLILAALGAVTGDAISYLLGRKYQERLQSMWPFTRYQHILEKGEDFFRKHGGKSVFLGRFIGPIRPVIPIVAGIMNMPGPYFALVNIASAIGWAIVYVVPGVVVGASLTIAGIVSTRLIFLTLIVISLLWSLFWMSKKVFKFVILKGSRWFESIYAQARLNSKKERGTSLWKSLISIVLPQHKTDEHVYFVMLFMLVICLAGFMAILLAVSLKIFPVHLNENIFYFLQSIRNPLADRVFVAITEMGDLIVFVSLSGAIILSLLSQRTYKSAIMAFISFSGSLALVRFFKWLLQGNRPISHLYRGVSAWGFPSGHTAHSAVLYGILFILIMRSLENSGADKKTRNICAWVLLSMAVTASSIIGFSRLYLGAHWFSDVLGGFFLGWSWISLCGVVYLKNVIEKINIRTITVVPVLVFLVIGIWHINSNFRTDMVAYAYHVPKKTITYDAWLDREWKELPGWRLSIRGKKKQPLILQYSGNTGDLRKCLEKSDWKEADSVKIKTMLSVLFPDISLQKLPILPRLYKGKFEKLIMFKNLDDSRLVLRLWRTNFRISKPPTGIYIGTIECQIHKKITSWITVPVDKKDYITPLELLPRDLSCCKFLVLKKNYLKGKTDIKEDKARIKWDGAVLLVSET